MDPNTAQNDQSGLDPTKLEQKPDQGIKSEILNKAKQVLGGNSVTPPAPKVTPISAVPQGQVSVRGMTSLLDALFTKKLISEEDLRALKFEVISLNKNPEEALLEKGKVSDDDIQRTKAEMRGIAFVDLSGLTIDQTILQKIPSEIAKQSLAIAFAETPLALKVGMADPLDLQKIQYLESITGKKIDASYASKTDIEEAISIKYGAEITKEVDEALASVTLVYEIDANHTQDVGANSEDAPVIRIVNLVLDYAAKHGASDIHIEPRESRISVRYRLNGILAEKLTIPRKLAAPVITRIKILANLKIDEHRIPQDGRFQIKVENRLIDLRVSVVPTVYGEKVVMRLLEKGGGVMSLEGTGLTGIALQQFKPQLEKTQGMILVTGPTGSGKTQTLASCLKIINSEEVNTMTLEDPVEIRIDGVSQVQVNPQVGLTFANGLRAFLRQDPDIIMVGEIRDEETAKLAVQASLTGHLVLATLHTNDAAGAMPRLIDMGVESYLLASTINVIAAQRLVRKLDKESVEPYVASEEVVKRLHEYLDDLSPIKITNILGEQITFDRNTKEVRLFKPTKTTENEGGFVGRLGIFEVLAVDNEVREMITAQKSAAEIRRVAIGKGMITLVQDGLIKAIEGLTTLEEVLRVIN